MAQKPQANDGPENEVVSKAKLDAWEKVRLAWKASGKPPYADQAVLDAEYEAANTD